jgi:3-dehydrosphinganine reductase
MNNHKGDWRGKTILVTGGSSGIGLEIARIIVKKGGKVWLLARRADLLEKAAQELGEIGEFECGILPADVSDPSQVFEAVERIKAQDSPPHALFNSAGIVHPGYVQELDLQVFKDMIDVNYLGTVYATKAVLPSMLERRSGIIVNIASIAAFIGAYGYTAYSASKFAARGFSDVLRLELKPYGIQVSLAFPPDTNTPQLSYEKSLRPPEYNEIIKIAGVSKPEDPKVVAKRIIKGVEQGRYAIFPSRDAFLMFWSTGIFGTVSYRIFDFMLKRALKTLGKI